MRKFAFGFVTALALASSAYWFSARNEHPGSSVDAASAAQYRCPMHPAYTAANPGVCPVCGMKLVKLGDPLVETSRPMPAGYAPVMVSPDQRRVIGLNTIKVSRKKLEKTVQIVGLISFANPSTVVAKSSGVVDQVMVGTGNELVMIQRGDPLILLRSAAYSEAQEAFLTALRTPSSAGAVPPDALAAAHSKLLQAGADEKDIAQIAATREPTKGLIVRAPSSGRIVFVSRPGTAVAAGGNVCMFIDLSTIEAIASVPVTEMGYIRVGEPVEATIPSEPGKLWRGRVKSISQQFDSKMQLSKVTVELSNTSTPLVWSDMAIDLKIKGAVAESLVVPESSVVANGQHAIVFVAAGKDLFEPREVELGLRLEGLCQVKKGLSAGEEVVTAASFLVDAESKLRAAALRTTSH